MFQFIKTQAESQYHTYLWFYCIMPIQLIWLCDTGSGKHRQIVNIQLPDVAESFGEDYQRTVQLPSANVSSVERIEPVHSKARERWGHLKSWKRIPGSTKHLGKWVTTSNVKPRVMKQLEQFAYVSGVRTIK